MNLNERIDAIEAGYECMLAYAAQGRLTYSDASGSNLASCPGAGLRSPIRRYKADTALAALDANGAIRVLAHPEPKALLGVRGPLEHALQVSIGVYLRSHAANIGMLAGFGNQRMSSLKLRRR